MLPLHCYSKNRTGLDGIKQVYSVQSVLMNNPAFIQNRDMHQLSFLVGGVIDTLYSLCKKKKDK